MEKETKKGLSSFWAALIAGAAGGFLGTRIANALDLNWLFLGILVAAIFLATNLLMLMLFEKMKK